ncbi:MAG: FAD-binding oxidoreductase [Hyphomicrobiaceae bacterium]
MHATSNLEDVIAELGKSFSGKLLKSGDNGYEEARRVHNGLIDKRPALIAQCGGVADVVEAVKLARKSQLEVAVRGGGHNVAGRATIDGGIMIDLSHMTSVRVDPTKKTAWVEGGATWANVNRETQLHGLAVTGGVVSSTGVGGLTLGGGLGWLMGKYGFALDNLISVELVTAEGEVVHASADVEPELFWALRGGGGNFGVATAFEFRLHPVGPTITGGLVAHRFEQASEVLRFFRESTCELPDEHMIFGGLVHAPDGSGAKLAAMVTCHCGSPADGEKAMAPIKAFGTPAMDAIGQMPYSEINGMLDDAYPKGALNYWRSSFLTDLSDAAIDTMIDCFAECPTPMGQLLIEHIHGAAIRVGIGETALPHRQEGYNFLILAEWMDHAENERCIAWARETGTRMQPFLASARYVNYLGDDEPDDALKAAYGPNYSRLQEIKARYDPTNFFRQNQNIQPLR